MTKKAFGKLVVLGVAMAVCSVLTGCNSVRNYSIQSYQGPLPMQDMVYVNAAAQALPTTPR